MQFVFQNVQAVVNPRVPVWKIVAESREDFDGLESQGWPLVGRGVGIHFPRRP